MRNYLVVLGILFGLFSCTPEEEAEETGAIMEYKINEDSLTLANGGVVDRDLSHEPDVVQDFFAISDEIITTDFCFDREKLLQVVVDGIEDEDGWHKFMVEDDANYFATDNYECYSEIEFKTFYIEGIKRAYLSQSNKNFQELKYLEMNTDGNWVVLPDLPFAPNNSDFFANLTVDEKTLVNEYGYYYVYMDSWGDTLKYVFSEWEMGLRMGEKDVDEFTKEADYDFSVTLHGDEFVVIENALIVTDTVKN